MINIDRRFFIIVIVLFIGILFTFVFKSAEIDAGLDERIVSLPREVGQYTSKDIELDDMVYDILETKNIVMRQYFKKDESPILFYIIFSRKTHKTSDPPENCLRGEGRSIISKEKATLSALDIKANKLLVEKSGRKDLYFYWFIAGDEFFESYIGQRFKLIMSYLKRTPQSGGQIRISTEVSNGEQEAKQRLEAFVIEMMPYLRKLLKQQ